MALPVVIMLLRFAIYALYYMLQVSRGIPKGNLALMKNLIVFTKSGLTDQHIRATLEILEVLVIRLLRCIEYLLNDSHVGIKIFRTLNILEAVVDYLLE